MDTYTGRTRRGPSLFGPGKGKCLCGRPLRTIYSLGRLTYLSDPDEIFWRKEKVPLKPIQVRILAMLILGGRCSKQDLGTLLERSWASGSRLAVHVSRIRSALRPIAGDKVRINLIVGYGYQLEVETK